MGSISIKVPFVLQFSLYFCVSADLWRWIVEFKDHKLPAEQLYQYIIQRHQDVASNVQSTVDSNDELVNEQANSIQSLHVGSESDCGNK